MTDPATLTADLRTKGYAIIPPFLSPSQLSTLRAAATKLTTLARAGHWPHVRTVGKQFPPWPAPSPSSPLPIWGVQHLLHPFLPLDRDLRDAFTELYFSRELLSLSTALLSYEGYPPAKEEDLVMELFNMLVRPDLSDPDSTKQEYENQTENKTDDKKEFALRWHRDDIPPSASPVQELALLSQPAWHAQWNLPLYDDASLILIPGSHRRARTDAERAAGDYEDDMPGQVRVELQAGDVAFYDSNILHRGVYDATKERMTLHGSVGHVRGSEARARNVLQHGVGAYVEACDFGCLGEAEKEVAEGMRRRLVEMGRGRHEVGFSLDG